MGKAAKRKEQRRIERALSSQSANDTQTLPTSKQTLVVQYHPLRHAISWADLSQALPVKLPVKLPIQEAANDPVIEAPTAPAVKQRKKPGPKEAPIPKEVRQAQLWAMYADLWDEMEEGMSPKERRALQRALARNSGTLDDLIENDNTVDSKESRRVESLLDDEKEYEESEIDYSDFFEDHDPNF